MLTKRINVSSAVPPYLQLGALLLLLVWPVDGQCPDVFSYQKDQSTQQLFGYIELHNLRIGQQVMLNVELSIGVALTQNNWGSITLVKPKQETIRDITNNQPAQYRINLPISNLLPRVFKITVNGQTICTGKKATGSFVSTITHQHMLLAQLEPVSNRFTESQDQCGKPSPKFSQLSINGKLSPKGQFPWAVPIFYKRHPIKPKYICGSTILNKYHLVTAGHCMFDDGRKLQPSDLLVTPGMYNIDNFFESDIQERDVASIIIHPDYDDYESKMNDIALMVLQQAIVYNDLVRPICLWNGNDNIDDIIGRKGLVSGWGLTDRGPAETPSYVHAKVVSNNQCRRHNGALVAKGTFCANGQDQDPCSGDSGSGLVFKQGSQFYIRGIVSRGQFDPAIFYFCDSTKYVVYTDIASYRNWLLQEMNV